MKSRLLILFLNLAFFILFSQPAHALFISSESGTPVTAIVQDQSFNGPKLITPGNNSTTANPQETLSWKRPDPLPVTPLDHYDVYIDNALFAQGVPDGLTRTEYYFYIIERTDNTFKLYPKSDLAQGYHTWKVVAYNTAGISSQSETWTYYIDSVVPYIKLKSVDNSTLNWDSRDLTTIPNLEQRYVYVTGNPLLTGEVEPYANLQFTLLCPTGIPSCNSLTQTFSYSNGKFKHRFYNLLPNRTYTVYLSATDAAGNSTMFPVFYLIHLSGPKGYFPPEITPVVPPTMPPAPTITLPSPGPVTETPTLSQIITPSEFLPLPPAAPTPPPAVSKPAPLPFNPIPLLLLLLVFGLPLHLLLSQFGTSTRITLTLKFFFALLFPFLKDKKFTTHPFTTVILYDPSKDDKKDFAITISDILGQYALPLPLPKSIFTKAFCRSRTFRPTLIPGSIYPNLCLFLQPTDRENTLQRFQKHSMSIRSLPLGIGTITSSIALVIVPSYFLLIYLYLCLQALFSEYIYPRISK